MTGFAYEPSWLAHQLNLVFLPVWLAATLKGYSAQPKFWRISLENVLLLGGIFTLYISASRIGWLSFLLVVASQALVWNFQLAQRIQGWFTARIAYPPGLGKDHPRGDPSRDCWFVWG